MAARDLDGLIRAARGAEAPSAAERAQVREGLARRIASGQALPDLDEAPRASLPTRSWLRGAGSFPVALGGLAVAALAVTGLAGYGLGRDMPSEARATAEAPVASANASPSEDGRTTSASALASGSTVDHGTSDIAEPNSSGANGPAAPDPSASKAPAQAGKSAARSTARAPASSAGRAPLVDHEAERRALARVQHALRDGRFSEAMAGLDRDDRAFTGGALLEERAAARVLARCGSGDAAGAQQLAKAFVARYPGSPLRSRVLASCPASAGRPAP